MTSSPSFMEFNNISKLLSLVFFKPFSLSPSQSLGLTGNFEQIEDIYFRMTQTEPLLGVYLKAINDTFEALSFSKFKKQCLFAQTRL
jgi:hypothetical protein